MIHNEHHVICDGCNFWGPISNKSAADAQRIALAGGWTTNTVTEHVGALHWCPKCTEARKEPR